MFLLKQFHLGNSTMVGSLSTNLVEILEVEAGEGVAVIEHVDGESEGEVGEREL